MNERQMAQYLETVERKVAEFGWAVQGVGGTRTEPVIHYTVGLWDKVGFELLAFGLDNPTGMGVLNLLAERVSDGERFTNGQILDDVAVGYKMMMIEVPSAGRHVRVVSAYYGLERKQVVPGWQVVYPDTEHRWPWEEGSTVAALPVLGAIPGTPGSPRPTQ